MKTLFSNARIINPETLSDTLGSVLIENKTITRIQNAFVLQCPCLFKRSFGDLTECNNISLLVSYGELYL